MTLVILFQQKEKKLHEMGLQTWGKHIGIPPRIAFGGLKIAYD